MVQQITRQTKPCERVAAHRRPGFDLKFTGNVIPQLEPEVCYVL